MNEEFIPQQVKQKTDRVSVGVKKEKKEERGGGPNMAGTRVGIRSLARSFSVYPFLLPLSIML